MTQTSQPPQDGEHFVESVQRIGAWRVVMLWPLGSTQGGPRSITIEPDEEGGLQEIARGVTTTVLRKIDIAAGAEEAASFAPFAQLGRQAAEDLQRQKIARFRQGLATLPEGLSDEYLAVISNLYVHFVDAGQRAPIADLEAWTGGKQATLKGHLRAARQRGYLTKVEGKAGGQLTEKATAVLRRIEHGAGTEEV
ncbi:hypothetical protein [Streptomyces anulatus]|uniref:hypothetical protein n=1 Tax=Streptomyces anulatus TaxID=1892 RepID=UPI00343C33BC